MKRFLKKRFLKLTVMFGLLAGLGLGLYANGFNLNSNGTKAISMGGAFVGLADDYSAVFWNPAGLTQMKQSGLSIFAADVIPDATYSWPAMGIDTQSESKHYISGSLGYFHRVSDRLILGLYAYVPSGLGAEWDGADLSNLANGMVTRWKTFLGIVTVSPAIAYKVSDRLSLGASVNINFGMAQLEKPGLGQYEEDLNGTAVGVTLGMLYQPTDTLSLGFTYKSPLEVSLKGDTLMQVAPPGMSGITEGTRELTWPMWIGAGIALKPTDQLTVTADVQYIDWKVMDVLPISYADAAWNVAFSDYGRIELEWESTTQIRFGMEYRVSDQLALRCGYYYDPSPSPKSTLTILVPQHTLNWLTLGFGYSTEKIDLDVGVEYGMGKDVEVGLFDGGLPGTYGMNIMVPSIALTIKL